MLYVKFRRVRAGTRVRFSPGGVQLDDSMGYVIQLAWPDITAVDTVNTQLANSRSVDVRGGTRTQVDPMRSLGLIGWAQHSIPARAPDWLRQHLETQPRNTFDGRPVVAIPLGGIDPNWTSGPMGTWVRHYRPDLLAGTSQGHSEPPLR